MEGGILDLGGSSELFSVVVVYRTTRVANILQVYSRKFSGTSGKI